MTVDYNNPTDAPDSEVQRWIDNHDKMQGYCRCLPCRMARSLLESRIRISKLEILTADNLTIEAERLGLYPDPKLGKGEQ